MGMMLLTLIVASSPWGDTYRHLWETPVLIGIGGGIWKCLFTHG